MLKYLALSVCTHALVVSMADVGLPKNLPQIPVLKVNLAAQAMSASQPTIRQARPTPPTVSNKALAETSALKKNVSAGLTSQNIPVQEVSVAKRLKVEAVARVAEAMTVPAQSNGKQSSTVIHKASYRRQIPPVYPRRALELGQEGTVTLHAEVMPTGQARTLRIAESSGYRLLDRAAFVAVKKWEFEPANTDGSTTTGWVRVPVRFVIR